MKKETSHNATAVREAYETALETIKAIVGGDASKLAEIVQALSYRIDKTSHKHIAGMPAKLWQRALMGVSIDNVMLSMFGDENAGLVPLRNQKARLPLGDKAPAAKKAPAPAPAKKAPAPAPAKKAPAPAPAKKSAKKAPAKK